MSRLPATDTVFVKPRNNVYTALAAAGTVVVLLGLLALWSLSSGLDISLFGAAH